MRAVEVFGQLCGITLRAVMRCKVPAGGAGGGGVVMGEKLNFTPPCLYRMTSARLQKTSARLQKTSTNLLDGVVCRRGRWCEYGNERAHGCVCTGVGVGGREQLKVTTSTHQVFCDLDARFCSCMDVVSNGVIVPRPYIVRSVSEWARILVNT